MFRILPLYLIYRPANNIPYATLEEDLGKPLQPYCSREWGCAAAPAAAPEAPSSSEVRQKCQTFQHWLYLWTNGSFLVTDLAGTRARGGCACAGARGRAGGRGRRMRSPISSPWLFTATSGSRRGRRPVEGGLDTRRASRSLLCKGRGIKEQAPGSR